MKGIIIINAFSDNEEYLYQARRMKEEFTRKGVHLDIVRNDSFLLYIKDNSIVSKIAGYDFCVYWDKDKYILKMLEKLGVPTFNCFDSIEKCDDKMLTYIELANQGIPVPDSLPGLLCYTDEEEISEETLNSAEALGYPLILKDSFGSLGNGVRLIKDREELKTQLDKVKCTPYLLQEFIETSYGRDVRIIVIGGEVIGGMLRTGDKDFRSNIGSGGIGEPYELSDEMKELAIKVAEILKLDYCGIDVLFGKNGPVICEVNSNAFFYAFENATKINVAEKYAGYIIKKTAQ